MGKSSRLKSVLSLGMAAAGSVAGATAADATPIVAPATIAGTSAASNLDTTVSSGAVTPAYVPPPRSPFVPPLRGSGS